MSWLWSQKKFDFSRLFHVVTTTHNLGSHRMDSWWSIDPFQEVHWDSNHWGGELWKECCNVCADWGARAHCRYVYFLYFIFYFYRVVCIENKYKVLPPNSRFLGPGISRELEIVNWNHAVSHLLIHCFSPYSLAHCCALSIENPWIGRDFFKIRELEIFKK